MVDGCVGDCRGRDPLGLYLLNGSIIGKLLLVNVIDSP